MDLTYFIPMLVGIPLGIAVGVAFMIYVSKSAGPRF